MSLHEWDWLHQNKRVNSGDDWKSYKTEALGKGKGGGRKEGETLKGEVQNDKLIEMG